MGTLVHLQGITGVDIERDVMGATGNLPAISNVFRYNGA